MSFFAKLFGRKPKHPQPEPDEVRPSEQAAAPPRPQVSDEIARLALVGQAGGPDELTAARLLVSALAGPQQRAAIEAIAHAMSRGIVPERLAHVGLPAEPDVLADGCTLAFTARSWAVAHLCSSTFLDSGQHASLRPLRFDVTGEPIPDWAVGTDPEGPETEPHGYEWGPPCAFDGVDPPGPDDVSGE